MLQTTQPVLCASIRGISHVTVEVGDLDAAEKFYSGLGLAAVGRDRWPIAGGTATATLRTGAGQYVVLVKQMPRNDPRISACHHAYAISAATRAGIIEGLAAKGTKVHRFHEDYAAETDDNFYVDDPSGNRIQFVARKGAQSSAIDHVAIETNNILWSREFYAGWLGFEIAHRVGWKTTDYLAAKSLGEKGMEAAMPGARYWNERYSKFETERKMLRPSAQLYLNLGGDAHLAIYLAARQYQAPLDDAVRGTPSFGLATTDDGLRQAAALFKAKGRAVEGPITHDKGGPVSASLHVKDAGANFMELCVLR